MGREFGSMRAEQMTLELFEKREPFNCPDEKAVVDIGGGKSFCKPWNVWTNCREVGHCVYERSLS